MGEIRASFYLDDSKVEEINKLKKEKFYDKSYADLYRYLIDKGLEHERKEA